MRLYTSGFDERRGLLTSEQKNLVLNGTKEERPALLGGRGGGPREDYARTVFGGRAAGLQEPMCRGSRTSGHAVAAFDARARTPSREPVVN